MRRLALVALAVLLAVLVFTLTSPDEAPPETTLPVLVGPTTTVGGEPAGGPSVTRGALPDGTPFVVTVDPGVPDDWVTTTGGIVMDIAGLPGDVGAVIFGSEPQEGYAYQGGRYHIPAAGLRVTIAFAEHALRALGDDAEATITPSIRGDAVEGHPVLRLGEPFRWGTDRQMGFAMAVRYSTFEVRRGCGDLAAACSPDGSLQVVWRAHELASAPPARQPEVTIERLPG